MPLTRSRTGTPTPSGSTSPYGLSRALAFYRLHRPKGSSYLRMYVMTIGVSTFVFDAARKPLSSKLSRKTSGHGTESR
jgi:hypothetical protein